MNSFIKFAVTALMLSSLSGASQSATEKKADFLLGKIDEQLYVNTDSAYHYSTELLDLAIKAEDSFLIASAYQSIGYSYYYKNQLPKTLEYFEKSKQILLTLNWPEEVGLIYMDFGNLYSEMGLFEKGLTYYEKAEEILSEYSDYPEDLAIIYYNLAHIFMDLGDYPNFEKYIDKTAKIVEQEEITYLLSAVKNMQAYLAIHTKEFDKAEELSKKALAESHTERDLVEQVFALENLGLVEMARGQTLAAIKYLDSSLFIARQYGDDNIIASQKATLASVYLKSGDVETAETLAAEAYQWGVNYNSLLTIKRAGSVYADALEKKGDYGEALKLYKIYIQAKDSISGFEVSEKLLKSQNRISVQQNELLKTEATLLKAHNTRNKILFFSTLVALVLCVVIMIMMKKNLRARKLTTGELQAKQKMIDEKSKELEQKNVQLQRMNTGKDKLFSVITHDMKEPFNQISSFIQILEHSDDLDPGMKDLISKIRDSTQSTLSAMNNLLIWSKSQFMNLQTQAEDVEMKKVVESVVSELGTSIREKSLGLRTIIQKDTILFADRNHVEIILRNLLSNAIKFSPKGGEVDIQVSRIADGVEIMVRDEGKGMTSEEVESIFDTQRHFSTPGTLNEKGTGLGMLIVSEFVKENKGTIEVNSVENKGSTFKVILPAA